MAERQPAEVTRWRGYLHALEDFGSPEEVRGILRDLGTPEAVRARNAEIRAMIEGRRFRRWIFGTTREIGGWIVGVGAAVMTLYALWAWLIPKILAGGAG